MILLNPGYYDMIYIYDICNYIIYLYIASLCHFFCKFILHKPVNAIFEALHRGLRSAPVGRLYLLALSRLGLMRL